MRNMFDCHEHTNLWLNKSDTNDYKFQYYPLLLKENNHMRYLLEIYYIEEHFDRTPFVHIVYLALYEIVTICLNIVLFLVQIFEFDSFRTKCTYQEKI